MENPIETIEKRSQQIKSNNPFELRVRDIRMQSHERKREFRIRENKMLLKDLTYR